MALVPKFTENDIKKHLQAAVETIEFEVIEVLKFVGEKFIRNARNTNTYTDRTGNLRSSIGYVIIKDGEQIESNFPGETKDGKDQAMKTIASAKEQVPSGLALIVVAGMDYAAAVEAKGYDVLTSSAILAEADLLKELEALKEDLS